MSYGCALDAKGYRRRGLVREGLEKAGQTPPSGTTQTHDWLRVWTVLKAGCVGAWESCRPVSRCCAVLYCAAFPRGCLH